MTPDWNAIRLDLLDIDAPMRATLREMRPFFAKVLPGILAAVLRQGPAVRPRLRHLQGRSGAGGHPPAAAALGPDRRRRIRPSLFQLGRALERVPSARRRRAAMVCRLPPDVHRRPIDEGGRDRGGGAALWRPAQAAARDKRASMQNAIAKAVMLDTENVVAVYFGSNRQIRRASQCQSSAKQLSDPASACRLKSTALLKSIAAAALRPPPRGDISPAPSPAGP